jgi:heat shock protein HslJ
VSLRSAITILLAGIATSSCHLARSPDPLAGTTWRLVAIQSMDDAVGTKRPADPSRYTMRLDADGIMTLRLDCNRATSTWSAEPGGDSSGRFEFGPLAATRAICLPPTMGEELAAQAKFVRSYVLKDERLYLGLMADGGIWAWERDAGGATSGAATPDVPFETRPDPRIEDAVRRNASSYTREIVGIGGEKARYLYGRIDLDDDGSNEVFVYLLGSIFCGTGGCDLMLFSERGGQYALVDTFVRSRLPIVVSPHHSAGWRDLVRLESGGGVPSSYVRQVYDGRKYVEAERLPTDVPPQGRRCLTGGFVFQDGIPLEPGDGSRHPD